MPDTTVAAAAERLRQVKIAAPDGQPTDFESLQFRAVYKDFGSPAGQHMCDYLTVAGFAMAMLDGTQIDEAWLREHGWQTSKYDGEAWIAHYWLTETWGLQLWDDGDLTVDGDVRWPCKIATRGQIRALLFALTTATDQSSIATAETASE